MCLKVVILVFLVLLCGTLVHIVRQHCEVKRQCGGTKKPPADIEVLVFESSGFFDCFLEITIYVKPNFHHFLWKSRRVGWALVGKTEVWPSRMEPQFTLNRPIRVK